MLKDVAKAVKANKTVMIVLGVLALIVIVFVVWKVFQGFKKGTGAIGTVAGRAAVQARTGIKAARQIACETVAKEAHMAIHGDGGWWKIPGLSDRVDEDEETFILHLNRLNTPAEAGYASEHYTTLWGKYNLKTDANKYLNKSEQGRIKPEIYSSLQ